MRIKLTKLILVGTRITYQATGNAGNIHMIDELCDGRGPFSPTGLPN